MAGDDASPGSGWLSRERLLSVVLGLATLVALWVCYRIFQPFIPAVAIAAAVAVATSGPHDWLRRRVRHPAAAAAIGVTLVTVIIVAPLSLLIGYLVRQVIAGVQQLQAGGGLSNWREALPLPAAVRHGIEWVDSHFDLQEQLMQLGQTLASQAGGLLTGSVNLIAQLAMMLFVLFFLYRDRELALSALRRLAPLSSEESDRMLARIRDTILATVNGSLAVAFVQALLAGVMYTALGVPASMVWASATFIVALIPMFGTFMVWGPVALYLLIAGSWVKAVILAGWGMLAVGTIDNLLYPYLVGGRLRLHTLPTFFSVVGGVSVFGPSGLILGPVALAVAMGLLEVWGLRTRGGATTD
jgi:predicted PurR-regulated permease PerM